MERTFYVGEGTSIEVGPVGASLTLTNKTQTVKLCFLSAQALDEFVNECGTALRILEAEVAERYYAAAVESGQWDRDMLEHEAVR